MANIKDTETQPNGFFYSGARPAAMWVCIAGFVYSFVLQPIFNGFGFNFPRIELDVLMSMTGALLGLSGYRTFEKFKGKIK